MGWFKKKINIAFVRYIWIQIVPVVALICIPPQQIKIVNAIQYWNVINKTAAYGIILIAKL